jgi:hypothetical protein
VEVPLIGPSQGEEVALLVSFTQEILLIAAESWCCHGKMLALQACRPDKDRVKAELSFDMCVLAAFTVLPFLTEPLRNHLSSRDVGFIAQCPLSALRCPALHLAVEDASRTGTTTDVDRYVESLHR